MRLCHADFSYFDRQEIGRHGQHGCEVVIEVKGYKTDVYKTQDKASPCVTSCNQNYSYTSEQSEKRNSPTCHRRKVVAKKTKLTPDPSA